LRAPKGTDVRPTADRVREALFSILGDRVVDATVLDLFAGTGALGIEALSRGAAHATFVDRDVRPVRANLDGIDGAEVVRQDARTFARTARAARRQYDLVFLDPPYRDGPQLAAELSETLAAVLSANGVVVSESDRRSPVELPDLQLADERRYGDTLIRLHAH
jgi:16S rRNA (guanine(966)-N(2))-methyltransferase RsmD